MSEQLKRNTGTSIRTTPVDVVRRLQAASQQGRDEPMDTEARPAPILAAPFEYGCARDESHGGCEQGPWKRRPCKISAHSSTDQRTRIPDDQADQTLRGGRADQDPRARTDE